MLLMLKWVKVEEEEKGIAVLLGDCDFWIESALVSVLLALAKVKLQKTDTWTFNPISWRMWQVLIFYLHNEYA